MEIDVLTIFPEVVLAPLRESILGRAQGAGHITLRAHDLREWSTDKHRRVDDAPYGGGPGMVMTPGPFFAAVQELHRGEGESRVIFMTPQGRRFDQATAQEFSAAAHLIILCGHYEGVDHRVVEALVDEEISIGDYVLTNGALAAAVMIDAVTRLLPGVLGDAQSSIEESFSDAGRLEAPQYTRPADFEGMGVPEVLLSGHHEKIAEWRCEQGIERTRKNRPDLATGD